MALIPRRRWTRDLRGIICKYFEDSLHQNMPYPSWQSFKFHLAVKYRLGPPTVLRPFRASRRLRGFEQSSYSF